MSNYDYQMLTENQVNQLIEEKLAKKSRSTIWYNPEDNCYYRANNPASYEPSYDQFVCHGLTVGNGLKALKGASSNNNPSLSDTEIDKARFAGISNEFTDEANGFWSAIDQVRNNKIHGKPLGAGVITQSDYSNIANVIVDATTIELISRNFVLLQAVTRKTSQNLVYTADDYTPYLNEPDVGENDVIPPRSISYTRYQITLKKAQGHVKASRWAEMAIRDHNVTQDNFRIVTADFDRIFSQEIATQLANFSNIAASGAWDAALTATDVNAATNPTVQLNTNSLSIRNAGGNGDIIALNSNGYQALSQNTYMRNSSSSAYGKIPSFENASSRVVTNEMLPGYTIYIDELLPNGSVYQYDRRGIEYIGGPTRTATINDDYGNFTSQIHDRWYGSGIRVAGFGIELTGAFT